MATPAINPQAPPQAAPPAEPPSPAWPHRTLRLGPGVTDRADSADQNANLPHDGQVRFTDLGEIIRDAAAGDEAAWSRLVELYTRRIYALARSRLGSPELAEEITQDVFVKVAQSFSRDRTERGGYTDLDRFEPWLFRIAMNRIRDEARARTRRRALHQRLRGERNSAAPESQRDPQRETPGPPGVDTNEDTNDGIGLAHLRRAMDRLSDADRDVLELRHHAQLGFQVIADQLGEPIGTVLARHHRALKKLRTHIETDTRGTPADANPRSETERDQP